MQCDALDWIRRKRSWPQFFRFARKLARIPGTAYNSALMLDPKLAELRKGLPKAKNPPLFGWTAEMHLLADAVDIALKKATHDPKASIPRPLTAVDHLSLSKRQAGMNRLIATFSPQHVRLTPQIEP
ncbi:hypothetical protein [Nocardia sp. NPDC057227]|uniref:hypothetical protein n=1 Tax=Nocardia sp. NPDC057227 TaxID=3346056 RepID=UPI00362FE67C